MATFRAIGPPWAVTSSLADLAAVSREAGDYGGAATLLREACGSVLATGDPAQERAEAASAAALGEKGFATAWATGRGMSTEAAVAEARANLADA